MDKKQTNEQTELHQFRKEPSCDADPSPVKSEFDWTNRFRVRVLFSAIHIPLTNILAKK